MISKRKGAKICKLRKGGVICTTEAQRNTDVILADLADLHHGGTEEHRGYSHADLVDFYHGGTEGHRDGCVSPQKKKKEENDIINI